MLLYIGNSLIFQIVQPSHNFQTISKPLSETPNKIFEKVKT